MKKFLASLCVVFGLGLSVTGCNYVDPCTRLAPPTPAQLAAVAEGVGVDTELENGTECELVNGTWQRETD